MSLKYELLVIAALVATTVGTARALEHGTLDLAHLAQKVLSLG